MLLYSSFEIVHCLTKTLKHSNLCQHWFKLWVCGCHFKIISKTHNFNAYVNMGELQLRYAIMFACICTHRNASIADMNYNRFCQFVCISDNCYDYIIYRNSMSCQMKKNTVLTPSPKYSLLVFKNSFNICLLHAFEW